MQENDEVNLHTSFNFSTKSMENIFVAAEPFLKLAKFVGFFPKSFTGPARKGNLKTSRTGLFATLCLFTLLLTVNISNVLNHGFMEVLSVHSKIFHSSWLPSVIFENVFMFVLFSFQLCIRDVIVKFLKDLATVDENVCNRYIFWLFLN